VGAVGAVGAVAEYHRKRIGGLVGLQLLARLLLLLVLATPFVIMPRPEPAAAACDAAEQIFTYPFNGVFGAKIGDGGHGRFRRAHNTVDSDTGSASSSNST
jgi:hypothetical protein